MRTRNRLIGWLILCCGVATFRFGPGILGLEDAGRQAWLAVPGVILPLVAALACYRAAKLSFAGDRKAWRNFSVASALYLLGNLCYLYYTLADVQLPFPTWPELSFLVMAIFFTIGMFQYGSGQYLISRIQIYNFGLIFCAVALSGLFLLHSSIVSSQLGWLGTSFAVVYPVLWFSVAAFGLVCLVLSARREKQFVFGLLLLGILCEACADLVYAVELMNGKYQVGGISSGLWVLSTTLIVWAAIEQMLLGRPSVDIESKVLSLRRRRLAEATVPGAAVAAVLLSAGFSGSTVAGFGTVFVALAVPLAVLVSIREHWALSAERDLRGEARKSRDALAASRQQLSAVLESTTDSVLVCSTGSGKLPSSIDAPPN